MTLSKHEIKTSAITRAGFEYQDLIGIQLLIAFYRDPKLYVWIKLEADDVEVRALDDILASRPDGTLDVTQVKFTVDPERYFLDWDWLLEKKPKGTSMLAKWANSVLTLARDGKIHSAKLRTNRMPSPEFAKALQGYAVHYDLLADDIKLKLNGDIGSEADARQFLSIWQFHHSEPMLSDLEYQLMSSLVPSDADPSKWLLLRDRARRWAINKNQPAPDGRIQHGHLTQIITKSKLQPMPQQFRVPDGYRVPRQDFHAGLMKDISEQAKNLLVLWGSPGRGKSTYLSYLIEQLRAADVSVIRHHYFLSLEDPTMDRVSFADIASSLMNQIAIHYPDGVAHGGGNEPDDEINRLRFWIEKCATYY
ncbi:hypothetical protein [Hyphomicrobium sp. D-2]|uniref:hypothetical protein n=1 Tax=Hyphomicrobium sp. D-2 TaxID=3041621 RepID=UPI002454C2FD|nr:hypothetical protein [Hyphomicrobium sp. D-2]MDH4982167.1 hypothetical protein [Hyphomicrobium sp. D-2]